MMWEKEGVRESGRVQLRRFGGEGWEELRK